MGAIIATAFGWAYASWDNAGRQSSRPLETKSASISRRQLA
jgi:hypothetical protein